MAGTTVQDFRVGRVLATAWSVYMKNFVAFSAVSLVILLPLLVVQLTLIDPLPTDPATAPDDNQVADLIYTIFNILVTQLVTATLVYGTIQEMRQQVTSTVEALTRGVQLALPVVGIALIVGILVNVGMLLLIVPGVILYVMFWVAIPVAVVERPGVIASLQRSMFLTKGNRWRIVGILVILWVVLIVVILLLGAVFGSGQSTEVLVYANYVVTVLITVVLAVVSAVGYHDLRLLKDGVDVDRIAAVFD